MKQLYKKDSKGNLRMWRISTSGPTIIEESGLYNGKLVKHTKNAKPKNVGKSNETTASEQAIKEAEAKYNKKLSKDYFLEPDEALNSEVKLPMLATEYEKVKDKIEFPCFVQPKLDGMRAHCNHNKFISRENNDITWMNHIWDVIKASPYADTFDGELYAHGYTFQENMKMTKKYRIGITELVSFNVYDLALPNMPFSERYLLLDRIVKNMPAEVRIVPTYEVKSMDDVKHFHTMFLEQGYEGTIIRWGNAGYKFNGRSKNLVKYKDFKDIALEILDVVPMDAQPTHGMIVCELNGQRFKATPKMSHTDREELLTHKRKFIGKTAEIRYFEETDGGLPRFPVFVGVRNDK